MIRLLIVAEQPAVLKGLQMRLAAESDLVVIGEASNSQTASEMALTRCPDVAIIDADMPSQDGIAIAKTLHLLCPQVSTLVLCLHDDALTYARIKDAGATAFIDKLEPTGALLTAIRELV